MNNKNPARSKFEDVKFARAIAMRLSSFKSLVAVVGRAANLAAQSTSGKQR